jgi:uncharacterized protein YwgA
MAAGDKQIILASEDVQRRNLEGVITHVRESRKIVNDLTKQVRTISLENVELKREVVELKTKTSLMQAKIYQLGQG